MSNVDRLRVELRRVNDVELLRDALESTLDYMDTLAKRRSENGLHVATRTRQLIRRRLAGQGEWLGVSQPPEVLVISEAMKQRQVGRVARALETTLVELWRDGKDPKSWEKISLDDVMNHTDWRLLACAVLGALDVELPDE